MSWGFTTQSRDFELIRPILPQYGTIQRPRRLRLRSSPLLGNYSVLLIKLARIPSDDPIHQIEQFCEGLVSPILYGMVRRLNLRPGGWNESSKTPFPRE